MEAVPGHITIIAFEAWWCAPCKEMERLLVRAAADHAALQILTVDAEKQRDLYRASGGTRSLPFTVVLDDQGKVVGRLDGYDPAGFDALLTEALRAR